VISYANEVEHGAVVRFVREAYMEIFPTSTIEQKLRLLAPGAYVAVTCSPSKGVDETLRMTARLAGRGFKMVPHIAARMVRDRAHLAEIMALLDDLPVDSIFVPGGDAARPVGAYSRAVELLRDLAEFPHRFRFVGVAAHPEGHPEADDDTLLRELEKKQPLANYLVTQMCFDSSALGDWLRRIRARGIGLPAYIGIPGVADRASLLKTSLRIGVGDSLRFLRRKSDAARQLMQNSAYTPDSLLSGLAPLLADPDSLVVGAHIFCFNEVEKTERWRQQALAELGAMPAGESA
jgi:methylenetetrahydrofolate reductase (NADPH)